MSGLAAARTRRSSPFTTRSAFLRQSKHQSLNYLRTVSGDTTNLRSFKSITGFRQSGSLAFAAWSANIWYSANTSRSC